MKPITFENLRRLIGGRRKNKDRNESPFKRSESFKRISIRKNYLESRGVGGGGGQKGRNPTKKPLPAADDQLLLLQEQRLSLEITTTISSSTDKKHPPTTERLTSPPVFTVPAPPTAPLPALPKDRDIVPPHPPLPAEQKRPFPPSPPPTTVAPVIDYGEWIRCIRAEEDLNNLKRSCSPPAPPVRYRYHVHKDLDDSSRTDSAISLGRIWMDAPMLPPTAPRSLELPARPVVTVTSDGQQRRAHHSLESALKDKREDRPVPSRRFHRYPVATDKTASRSSVASTCSGKDSGFSLSAPGLSDPPRPPKQLFRKKVPRRPVAAACKPTAATTSSPSLPSSLMTQQQQQDQLYQVVVARSPLRQLKLDPMMFVPPEKRRTTHQHLQKPNHHHPKPRSIVEIRDYCVPKDARLQPRDDDSYDDDEDEQDRLYESISKGVGLRWQESTDDADTEDDLYYHQNHHHHHRKAAEATSTRNRVKRKKSARRNIKYVVKPVRRAPSVATRKPSVTAKSKSAWITSTSYARLHTRSIIL